MPRVSRRPALGSMVIAFAGVVVLLMVSWSTAAFATDEETDPGLDRVIAEGRLVYEANCVGCHQASGEGISGVFPPLVDNPHIADTEYLRGVVANGLMGEIEVNGEIYNGAMPAFALLDDAQIDAVVLFVQEGLGQALPEAPQATPDVGGLAGTELPASSSFVALLGFLTFAALGVFVLWPVVVAPAAEGTRFEGPQAWLKSGVIVAYFIVLTVIVPSMVVESDALAGPPSVWGDLISSDLWDVIRGLIGSGVWLVAFGMGVWGLRWVQKRNVV